MSDGLLCDALLRFAAEAVALGLRKDILAALIFLCTSFYARHTLVGEESAFVGGGHNPVEGNRAFSAHTAGATFLGVEVVLTGDAGNDLPVLGHPQTLGVGFVVFHE